MKTISIKHGEFKNLDRPPMTKFFQVKDASMLDKVKAKRGNCWMWVNKAKGGSPVNLAIQLRRG